MIKIEKHKKPSYLESADVRMALDKMEEFYGSDSNSREQKRFDFPMMHEIDRNLKAEVSVIFHNKCSYCEILIEEQEKAQIDRFRPYNGVRDGKLYFKDLYWWLTYDWGNLFYSCEECSKLKANYFPIKGIRTVIPNGLLENEHKLLVDPHNDNPSDHFYFINGEIASDSEEGTQTIELLRLNRPSLVKKRTQAEYLVKSMVDVLLQTSSKHTTNENVELNRIFGQDPSVEFLAVKHAVLMEEITGNPFVASLFDKEVGQVEVLPIKRDPRNRPQSQFVKSDLFSIEYIQIENFRSIENIKLEFPIDHIDENAWIAILGENGLGKSSILQAICFGLAHSEPLVGINILDSIGRDSQAATITVKQRDSDNTIVTTISNNGSGVSRSGVFNTNLIGYGSIRLLPSPRLQSISENPKVKYGNLFDPTIPLSDIFEWLSNIFRTEISRFNAIAYALMQLLPDPVNDELEMVETELRFKNSKLPFKHFSDGYKSTIALALDIMKSLSEGNTDINKLSGIVVIDELGNQLHPRWQMQVVAQLRKVFPRVSFIISTHHPLCLRGLKEREVVVLRKDANSKTTLLNNLPYQALLRVDQILTSPFFGLYSAIDPTTEKDFDRYYELLVQDELTPEQEREKLLLSDRIPKMKYFGNTVRDEIAIYVIDELLAKQAKGKGKQESLESLKEQAKLRVKEIWDSLDKNTLNDIR